ncbi:hypothetical protein [Paenibacillus dauci]|uniref:hypothetical protein n=1 Tax=Paenibacillus dauci TaxID=1567106 RepID=UPI00061905A2|nr:hypothetical protein [Paenibacillus dauci]
MFTKKMLFVLAFSLLLTSTSLFSTGAVYAADDSASNSSVSTEDTTSEDLSDDLAEDYADLDPALAAEATQLLDYLDQLKTIASYEDKAVDTYNSFRYVTSSNRKKTYAAMNNTVVPNYTKFVVGLKQIKPETPELAKIHDQYVKAASLQLQALTLFKKYVSTPQLKVATLKQANLKVDAGIKMLKVYRDNMDDYLDKFE